MMSAQRTKLIFLHIPKTAGTTLYTVIERQFHADEIYRIDGDHNREDIERFSAMAPDERERVACVIGHCAYGMHRNFAGQAQYLTMLRDPVDRIISHYYYVRQTPGNNLHDWLVSNNIQLEDYIFHQQAAELNNGQTRQLCGIPSMDAISGNAAVSEAAVEAAKQHLEEIVCIGLTEAFDKSLLLFQKVLDWKRIYYHSRNVNEARPQREAISESVCELIRNANKLDVELYAYASKLFNERCQQYHITQESIESFQRRNHLYNHAYAIKSTLRKFKRLVIKTVIHH
jgi:hypothetical protein